MPCHDPRDSEEQADKTAWLCAIMKKVEAGEPVVVNEMPKSGALKAWWESHKKWDHFRCANKGKE